MADTTYDIAPWDPSVKQDPDLFDSAETDSEEPDRGKILEKAIAENEWPQAEPVGGFTPSPTPTGLSAQVSPAAQVQMYKAVSPPDPLPFLDEPSAPSEAELRDAWVKLTPNSGLDAETAKKYGDILRRGAEAEKNDQLAKTKENFKAMYRTPEGVLQMAKNPVVRREMDASPDDDLVIKRALNRNFIATMYNKPNASPEELDALMREHSIRHWGINNPSQETFYTKTREDVLKSDEEDKVLRSMTTTLAQTILEDQLTRKQSSLGEIFEKFAKANPKEITAQNKDQWYQRALLVDERLRKLGENIRFPAASVIDLVGKVTAGQATEIDWDRATNALRGMNPNDLTQALKVAALAVREHDPKGEMIATIIGNLGKRFDRDFNLSKVYEQDRELLLNDQIKNLEAGMVIGKDANGRLAFAQPGQPLPPGVMQLDPEEYKAYWNDAHRARDGMQIARVIQQFQEQVADPIVPYFKGGLLGAAEAGAYDIAGFSKLIPLGLIPGPAGLLSMAKVISASTYHDIRLENPDLPIEAARDWANLDGVFNSVGMKFKTDFLFGHYPFFKSVRTLKGVGQTLEALKVYGRWAGVHQLEENFEELAQDTLSASLEKLYGDAYPDSIKQKTWGDMLVDIAKTRPQVAMAVGPLSLIGAGHATIRDLRNPMRDFMNPDALKSVGLKDDAVAEVLAAHDLDEAEKIFRSHYNKLTPEDVKAGFEYAAGLTEKDEVDTAMADPALPTLDPVVMPDGTYKYNVLAPDGTILSTHTDPDVAETAWVRETERVQGEYWAEQKNIEAQQAAEAAAAAASDEGVAKEAEARATAETVSPEDRLGTALVLDFEENVTPTPEESQKLAGLQADVAAAGRPDQIVLARVSDTQTGPGKATLDFVRAYEAITRKQVVFVASGNDQPLSFTGVVRKSDPNTIFLDAAGDRNLLALIGHEWSHTLEHSNPELYREMVERMKPLVVDWAKQEGILAKEVGPESVTNEIVANIAGDMMSREDFWARLADSNPTLFEKVRGAVMRFFIQFINKVRRSEFGSEAFITDLERMRDVVADTFERAQTMPAEAAVGEGVSFAPRRGHKLTGEAPSFAGRRAAAVERETTARMAEPEGRINLFQKMRDRVLALIKKHDAGFPGGQPKRISLIQAIGEYNAMLRVLPPEIRGRVGAYGDLTRIGRSEEALAKFFTRQIERIDKVLERQLRQEYRERIDTILGYAKPKRGKKPVGKIGVEGHRLVNQINNIMALDPAALLTEKQKLLAEIAAAEAGDTDKIADLTEALQLHEMFGDFKRKTAESLAKTYAFIKDVYTTGRNTWKATEAARIANIKSMRVEAITDTGMKGSDPELIAARERDKNMVKGIDNAMSTLLSFEQVVQIALGKDSDVGKQFVARERAAKSQKRAARLKFEKEFNDLLVKLYPNEKNPVKRERKRWEMQQRDKGFTVKKTEGDVKLSQTEAIHMTLLWKQDRYKETMRSHGWEDSTMEEIENKLSPQAKAIRSWFATKYEQGHASINEVFKRMYGIDLPKEVFYSPGTFEHEGPQVSLDPYGHGLIPEGGLGSSFLKGRVEHMAIPRIEDAYNVFLGHITQTEHWKAYAELTRDMRAVLGNVDVKRAIEAKEGEQYYQVLVGKKGWLTALERNGIDVRTANKQLDALMRKFQSSYAKVQLAYNVATMLKQSSAALGAAFDMPAVDYWKGFAKFFAGKLEVRKIYNHPMIQNRMGTGYSPESRMAIDAMFNAAPTMSAEVVEKGMTMIGNVDAFFTTASAAISYDYAYNQAIKEGATPDMADKRAIAAAEATVARTAQPAEMSDRSLFELGLTPSARSLFMFMTEQRQKLALDYMALRNVVKDPNAANALVLGKVLILNHFLIPAMMFGISAMWRDIRDDDDEEIFDMEHWDPTDFLMAMAGPLTAIPGVNAVFSPVWGDSPVKTLVGATKSLVKDGWPTDQEKIFQLLKKVSSSGGYLAAAMGGRPEGTFLAVGIKELQQIYQIIDNFSGEPKD